MAEDNRSQFITGDLAGDPNLVAAGAPAPGLPGASPARPDFHSIAEQFAALDPFEQQLIINTAAPIPASTGANQPGPEDDAMDADADEEQRSLQQRLNQLRQTSDTDLKEVTLPPPDPAYDGTSNWPPYRKRLEAWLTARNTPYVLWTVRSIAALKGAALEHFHSCMTLAGLTLPQLSQQPDLLTWEQLDQWMGEANFGSPATDASIRSKLCSFKQRRVNRMWNTPRHLSAVLLMLHDAPHQPDDHTAIWLISNTLYPPLQARVQLRPHDNQPFASLEEFLAAVRVVGAVVDRDQNEAAQRQQQLPPQQQQQLQPQPQFQHRPFRHAGGANVGINGGGVNKQRWAPYRAPQSHSAAAAGVGSGTSPHAGKGSFNARLPLEEVKRRKAAGQCFFCTAGFSAPLDKHQPTCRRRQDAEQKRKASGSNA